MTTNDECCGWLGWAELAGIGADGKRLPDTTTGATTMKPVEVNRRELPFITAALRRMQRDHRRDVRPQ
jgi:hypothetical protein